jgi:7-cyano-7-deazaguanine tRNA-ribosyltransferase
MRDVFEVGAQDGLARIGELDVPRAGVTVETPTLMPVVNPNLITVEPSRFAEEFGAELLITNSYIINRDENSTSARSTRASTRCWASTAPS